MPHNLIVTLLAVCISSVAALADTDRLDRELDRDVVLRAMVDELDRSKDQLKLDDLERPYFIEYALLDGAFAQTNATLGAVTRRGAGRQRPFRSDVRVGSYELDNTNFSSGGYFSGSGADMPIENDYDAIRQAIWWTTDADYKSVAEDFVRKKAFMESKLIEDKPNDFSREEPAIYFEEPKKLAVDAERIEELAVKLSAIFQSYPQVRESSARAACFVANRYLVNTEGTRMRTGMELYTIVVSATVQADDGMMLGDTVRFQALELAALPALDKMIADCKSMADRLLELKNAPVLDSYTGPVLFEPESAASLFVRRLAGRFAGGQRNVGSRTDPNDFANKLGKRILPKSVSVIDDPTRETVAGVKAYGHYLYDDQGVRARPVTLVEKGKLIALLMSRNPSKEFDKSTGHGRGLYQARARMGDLIVTSSEAASPDELKAQLLEAAADEDLEFAIRIASLGSVTGGHRYGGMGGMRGSGSDPLRIYKVYPDGREELVRGAELSNVTPKAFKRILALGDRPHVLNNGGRGGAMLSTAAVPALLFEELDMAKIDRDFDRPPILPSPLARGEQVKNEE